MDQQTYDGGREIRGAVTHGVSREEIREVFVEWDKA